MRRVPRWWAGKGPAAKPQISRSAANAFRTAQQLKDNRDFASLSRGQKLSQSSARCPHRA
ncbi:hypothetical protein E1J24_13575 [Xanthomonas hortorum pv. pelargonii]|uniref:Uncharacterized protein n=1 Tax=Xanthomonas hortorum pv. pelargonii TaxID=453602 RepID=A0AAW9ZTQ4_9XANT|nr:hypothetical protein [Xanthomonas hortorum pv. pelargonii]